MNIGRDIICNLCLQSVSTTAACLGVILKSCASEPEGASQGVFFEKTQTDAAKTFHLHVF